LRHPTVDVIKDAGVLAAVKDKPVAWRERSVTAAVDK
jgi:hypothetical protein